MKAEPLTRPRGRPRDPGVDDNILNSAVALLTEGGFERLSMEAVACHAGVAKATIYRRFPSKVDLIVAMCQAVAPEPPPEIDTGSIRGDLVALVEFLADTMGNPEKAQLMRPMLGAAKEHAEVREAMARFSATRRRRIYDIVKAAVKRGDLRPDTDAALIGDLLVGAVMYRTVIRDERIDRKFMTRLVDGILDGFAART